MFPYVIETLVEVWENSKLRGNTRPAGSCSHFNFSFSQTSTRVSITVYGNTENVFYFLNIIIKKKSSFIPLIKNNFLAACGIRNRGRTISQPESGRYILNVRSLTVPLWLFFSSVKGALYCTGHEQGARELHRSEK